MHQVPNVFTLQPDFLVGTVDGTQVLVPVGRRPGDGRGSTAAPVVVNEATTEGADRALTAADAGAILVCAANRAFTVNVDMPVNFGPAATGAGVVTWTAGPGVTITDKRTTGAVNPYCALVRVGADTYDVIGSKA